jgi:O-antigen ligase
LAFLLTIGGFIGALVLVRRYGGLMAGLDRLSSGRVYLLEAALQAFLRRPWFGSGLTNTPPILIYGQTLEIWHAHNFIMDLLMFSGMVGATIQCCIYLLAAHSMRIKAAFSPWAMGGFFSIIAILIDALAEPSVFTYKVDALLWMVIGIGYALYNAHGKPLVT